MTETPNPESKVSVEEIQRVIEIGRLLLSVLTSEELEELQSLVGYIPENSSPIHLLSPPDIGNTGLT